MQELLSTRCVVVREPAADLPRPGDRERHATQVQAKHGWDALGTLQRTEYQRQPSCTSGFFALQRRRAIAFSVSNHRRHARPQLQQ